METKWIINVLETREILISKETDRTMTKVSVISLTGKILKN